MTTMNTENSYLGIGFAEPFHPRIHGAYPEPLNNSYIPLYVYENRHLLKDSELLDREMCEFEHSRRIYRIEGIDKTLLNVKYYKPNLLRIFPAPNDNEHDTCVLLTYRINLFKRYWKSYKSSRHQKSI